jgi:hypothetical protein
MKVLRARTGEARAELFIKIKIKQAKDQQKEKMFKKIDTNEQPQGVGLVIGAYGLRENHPLDPKYETC